MEATPKPCEYIFRHPKTHELYVIDLRTLRKLTPLKDDEVGECTRMEVEGQRKELVYVQERIPEILEVLFREAPRVALAVVAYLVADILDGR